jgi:hypothetical protein
MGSIFLQYGKARAGIYADRSAPLLVEAPALKLGAKAYLSGRYLMIEDGRTIFRCRIAISDDGAIEALNERPEADDAMVKALARLTGGDADSGVNAVVQLTRSGLVVQHPARPLELYDAEYIGYRLIDAYRSWAPSQWNNSPLIQELRRGGRKDLATGFLLETYFIVRDAHRTASAVLAHHLTATQRTLLRSFQDEEADHSELLVGGFAHLGLPPDQVRAAEPNPESALFNDYFFCAGHQSVAHFAAALIIPEIDEHPSQPVGQAYDKDGTPRDLVDLLERSNGIPAEALTGFRRHAALDGDAEHAMMPVQLMAQERFFTPEVIRSLARTVAQGIAAYGHFMDGIHRRYRDWNGSLVVGPIIGEY